MQLVKIKLNSIEDVRTFIGILASYSCDIDIISGKYMIDAKSIMSYFCLNLNEPLTMQIHSNENSKDILDSISAYIVE